MTSLVDESAAAPRGRSDAAAHLEEAVGWSFAERVTFRFALAYLIVATFPGPVDPLDLQDRWVAAWKAPVGLLLGHPVARLGAMSDRLSSWILTGCWLALAAVVAVRWSIVDRRANAYPRLARIASAYLRYWLGAIVFGYGVIKVVCGQFPAPDLASMIQPLGQQPPMVLLWNTMGASPLYQAFGGAIEVAGALLLFFRRTALLGALVTAAAMANVLALNVGYDVEVKQLTLHLLLAALVIVFVHRARLVAFFFRAAAAPPPPARIPLGSTRLELALRVAGYALAAWIVASGIAEKRAIAARNTAPLPPWCGLYEVTSFSVDGQELAPRFGDHARWRRVVVFPGALVAQLGDDEREIWLAERDDKARTFSVRLDDRRSFDEPLDAPPTILRYEEREGEVLALDGALGAREVTATLHRVHPTFRLERPTGQWVADGSAQR